MSTKMTMGLINRKDWNLEPCDSSLLVGAHPEQIFKLNPEMIFISFSENA